MCDDLVSILVVDDSRDILDIVELALEDEYTVICAEGPQQALVLFDQHKIELLLSDVVMPGMSGIELVALVLAKAPTVKVVIMTGYTTLPIHYPVLHKPFGLDALTNALKAALESAHDPSLV